MSLSVLRRSSNTMVLPFDILLVIIDEIAYTNDVYTMRSCSLLHPALLPHCQKYLFRTFDMRKGTPDPDQYFFKFYTLLTKSPHLARYVRILHILYLDLPYVPIDERMPNQPYTVYFLRLLTNVEAFGLHFVILTNFKWGNLSLEFQYEIRRIMTQPCSTELTLTGLDYIPRSVINDCRFVKSLSMTACSLECWNPEKAVMSTEEDRMMSAIPKKNWVHLESAKFSNCERLFESLYPCSNTRPIHLDFSNLKHLTITLSPDTMEIVWKFIHSMSPTLETLTFHQTYKFETIGEATGAMTTYNDGCLTFEGSYQTLSPLSRLYRFSFLIILYALEGHSALQHFSELCTLLRTCPSSIREVCIKLDLHGCDTVDVEQFFFPLPADDEDDEEDEGERVFLQELDQTLSDRLLFPCLENVQIDIVLEDEYESDSEYAPWIHDELARMPLDEIKESAKNMMKWTEQSLEGRGCLAVDVWVRNEIASS